MANRYWVNFNAGADGNWDNSSGSCWSTTDGGTTGASAPVPTDNVFFTSNSGTDRCLISAGDCQNVDTTGYLGTFAWASSSSVLRIYGNAVFTKPITGSNSTGGVRFLAISTNLTISSGTNFSTCPVQIGSGSAGALRCDLTAALSASSISVLANASLFTQGFTVNVTNALTTSSSTAIINPGSSTINCGTLSFGNTSFSSGGSSIINVGSTVSAGVNTFGTVNIIPTTGTATLSGTGTYTNLTLNYSNNICSTTTLSGTHSISGTFTITGNNRYPKIQNGTINAAAVSISNVLFSNVTYGGAATWTGTNVGLFGAPASGGSTFTYTAGVANTCTSSGSQDWYNPSIWSAGRAPLPQDDVVIRSISTSNLQFTNTLNTFPGYIQSFKLETTSTGGVDFTLATDFYITKGVYFDVGTFMPKGAIIRPSFNLNGWAATAGSQTLTNLAGSSVQLQSLTVNNSFSTYTITNNLSMNGTLQLLLGTLSVSDNVVLDCFSFSSPSASVRSFTFGNNVSITCGRSWVLYPTNLTLNNLINTPITMSEVGSTASTFGTGSSSLNGGIDYGTVTFGGGSTNISMNGANTFKRFVCGKSVNVTINFHGGLNTSVESWEATGKSGATLFLVVTSGTTGPANIVKTGGGFTSSNFLSINNVTASPTTDTWYAGANSTTAGGTVTGWIFTNAPSTFTNNPLFFGCGF